MKFKPRNRYLLLGEMDRPQEEDKATILLPEEYKARINPHSVYQIVDFAEDCTKVENADVNKLVLVDDSMVETIKVDQGTYIVVLENYVIGILED